MQVNLVQTAPPHYSLDAKAASVSGAKRNV